MHPKVRTMQPSSQKAVVVGAGMAGLATAIALQRDGFRVTVIDRAAVSGGKMRTLEVAGRAIDSGPTVLTMPWAFSELLAEVGIDMHSEFPIEASSILARHAWQDGSRLDLYSDLEASVDAVSAFAGRREGLQYRAFSEHAKKIYKTVEGPFIRAQRPSLMDMVTQTSKMGFSAVTSIEAHRTFQKLLCSYFHDPRLVQLFGRYATYSGSSPFEAPGTLALIAHVEREGVYLVPGGIHRLAQFLERVATRLGVTFVHEQAVTQIREHGGRAIGVDTSSGSYDADVVVFAGDANALASGYLGHPARCRL
jgi:1-hydroxycarotenoid 3,4-desaturase